MRVLFVNTYYYPNMFGGAEHSVKLLAEEFSRKYQCAVFSVDAANNDELVVEKQAGITIFRSGSSRFDYKARYNKTETKFVKLKNRLADLYNPIALRHFNQVLDRFKPDIIHSNGVRGIGPLIWKQANKHHIKVVHTLRDYFVVDPTMKMKHLSFFMLWRSFFSLYSSNIDYLAAPSNYTLDKIISTGFGSTVKSKRAIPNATDIDKDEINRLIENKRERLVTRFIFVGTLGVYKGILNLITAFNQMQNKNAELVICGSGVLEPEVLKAAKSNFRIIYRGQLSSQDLKKEYQKSDVCVIPSLWDEPFGRVVIEAAANGCALIASRCGGIPEIIRELNAGELADCTNTMQLKEKLDLLCDFEARKKQLHNISTNIFKFSKSNHINSYENIYLELCPKS